MKVPFRAFGCPFRVFECAFKAFECPFRAFECPFKAFERRFQCGLTILVVWFNDFKVTTYGYRGC